MNLINLPFAKKYQYVGVLFLRLAFGFQLIHGTQDNVFSWERMLEFSDFLEARHVPLPLIAAHISVYAQFISGILLIIGFKVRLVGLIMAINFIFALIIAHIGLPYEQNFPAINLLAVSLFFMFYGAGWLSVDEKLESAKREYTTPPLKNYRA